ncbi:MAG: PRC-barrel domain-containing protein [bacterium]
MRFKDGASVVTAGGDKVGRLDRVVLNPKTCRVTHLVVRKGFLLTRDRVVPAERVASTDENTIRLGDPTGDPETFPEFRETEFVDADVDMARRTADDRNYAAPI